MFKYYMKSIGLCTLDTLKSFLDFLAFCGKFIFFAFVIYFSIDGFAELFLKIVTQNPEIIIYTKISFGVIIIGIYGLFFSVIIIESCKYIKKRAKNLKEDADNKLLTSN